MAKKKIHVVPYGGGWAVKREGADRASKITDTKAEAIEAAQEIAYRNDDEVIVHNKKGHITKGKKYGKKSDDDLCFITTACVRYYNLSDNCYQLSTLRNFRDNYLKNSEGGSKLIKQYYCIAPQIVKLLNQHPHKNRLYKNLFQQINFACLLIEKRKSSEAKKVYIKVVVQLAKLFSVSLDGC